MSCALSVVTCGEGAFRLPLQCTTDIIRLLFNQLVVDNEECITLSLFDGAT